MADRGPREIRSSLTLVPNNSTLHLPRLLCLHGGGTNARIFHAQCRTIRRLLARYFRLVFVDGPFFSSPGPDVCSIYADWGPFRSWFPMGTPELAITQAKHGPLVVPLSSKVIDQINRSITEAMISDGREGATGEWVGVLGFSQGAKLAASLLLRRQAQAQGQSMPCQGSLNAFPPFRFAVLLAGRLPLVSLDQTFGLDAECEAAGETPLLALPTVHVHGVRDPGFYLHRELLVRGCRKGSAVLVEWDGDHRMPIRSWDAAKVVESILAVARKTCVL